jgi:hypothetical protein
VSLSTTKPQGVLDLDWTTTDPLAAATLGKALARRGHVVWRPQRQNWLVIDPRLPGVYWEITRRPDSFLDKTLWEILDCTCTPEERKDDPCVHKAAVAAHATQPCEYRVYTDGF